MRFALSLRGVTKTFGGVAAVSDVSFDVPPGIIKAIIGPNGAGKSTLLNVISGILPPDRGEIRVNGRRLEGRPGYEVVAHGIARTFQLLRLFNNNGATVLDNVLLGAHSLLRPSLRRTILRRADTEAALRDKARALLASFGLEGMEHLQPQQLPFGQQRYVELARALMTDPPILLLDEPASGLNDAETAALGAVLDRLRTQGKTIVLIEHHMGLVMRLADEVLVLAEGRKLAEGTPDTVRRDPAVVSAYLGDDGVTATC